MPEGRNHARVVRARRNVLALLLAHAVLGAQMPMIFIIGGLAGQSLTSNPCFATLPISLIVLGSMVTAPQLSAVMQRHGRRASLTLGALGGAVGAATAALGLLFASFSLFLLGSFLTGTYHAAQASYRFAAADAVSSAYRSRAMSYVLAGGLAAAIIGPQLTKITAEAMLVPFLGTYVVIVVLNLLGMFGFMAIDIPPPRTTHNGRHGRARSRREMITTPRIAVAVICGMVSYSLMTLVMTSAPLAMVGCGLGQARAADAISVHVLAMFLPSFFTGHLIARFGAERVVAAGATLLACAGLAGLAGVQLGHFLVGLTLLGVGWNFGFVGASSMLYAAHGPAERGTMQGLNDFIVFGGVTLASLASGGLLNCSGESVVMGWNAVNIAMLPFLALAGAALVWLAVQGRNRSEV